MGSTKVTIEEVIRAARERRLSRDIPGPFTRDGEVWLGYTNLDAGVCSITGKALATSLFCWDHRISDGVGRPEWTLGEDSFPGARHIDGSPCNRTSCNTQSRCPQCRQYNTLQVENEAWATVTRCSNCPYEFRFSIGD